MSVKHYFWLILWFASYFANVDLLNQPRILSSIDGDLLLEATSDRNITFRLSGDSKLLVNNVDIDFVKIKQRALPQHLESESFSIETVTEQLAGVKRDLNRLTRRVTRLQIRFRSAGVQPSVLRRNLARLQRTATAITQIQTRLLQRKCRDNPCKNGATCYDGYNSFQCDCAAGWEGTTCENDVNECTTLAGTDLSSCANNGQCINTPGSYRCICRNGFVGTHCRLRKAACNTAQSAELCGHGTCIPANNGQGYLCICDQGWTKENNTAPCNLDLDECEPSRNPCHGECINLPGSFKCGACPVGYTGDGRLCRDIDECANNNGGCSLQPKVRCINTEGSYHCGRCPIGWSGDGHTCEQAPLNSCDPVSKQFCHPSAKCEYISETMVCTCPLGMYGHGYGNDGCSLKVLYDACADHKCENNGTCLENGRGTTCICQKGYTGPLCAQTDACHNNPCQNGGTCLLLPEGKYKCFCARGSSGINCEFLRSYCGASMHRESGSLQFPPNGRTYEADERCAFMISTDPSKILNVTFNTFQLEPASDCHKDFLQIHDGSSLAAQLIGRFCGETLPNGNGQIISTHHILFFWFRSDNETQALGFNISWISQAHVCGDDKQLLLDSSGVIRSPGYPGKTSPRRDCEWILEAPFGYRLLVHFYEVTLGANGENCTKDSLTIHDSDRVLLKLCETDFPQPLHSSSNELSIRFHTDSFRSDSSFQLHYEVVSGTPGCGGLYTEPSGIVSGYINAPICLYLIRQPKGTTIQLSFVTMDLLQSEECNLQKIEVFDGRSTEDKLLKRFCGNQLELNNIVSSENHMLVRYEYKLYGLELSKRFEFKYQRECNNIYSENSGIITTPDYPNPYLEHLTCTFTIQAPLDHVIHINITDLSITETVVNTAESGSTNISIASEDVNYLDVYLDKDVKRRFYKSARSILLLSLKNQAKLVFHANSNKFKSRGLHVEYSFEMLTCGGVLNNENPMSNIMDTSFCEWIIMKPEGKGINLNLQFLTNSANSLLYIFDNSTSGNGMLLDKMDISNRFLDKTYDSNYITIIYNTSDNIHLRDYINLNFETVDLAKTCGGVFSSSVGYIKSPNWPKPYQPSQNCNWLLKMPIGHQMELVVKNFSLETTSETMCSDDYLEIRNGDTPLSPLIGRYCGRHIPPRIPSFGNRLYISFHSDSYLQDEGFFLTWQETKTGCGGKLTSYVGSIHSPHNSIDGNIGTVACDWQIFVAQGSKITLELNTDSGNLCDEQLSFFDGTNSLSPQLKFNCTKDGEEAHKQVFQSTGSNLLVRYSVRKLQNDDEPNGLPFVLNYKTNCNVVLDKPQGVIESPNFPETYPPNMNCEWDIRGGGRKNKISLVFSHFSVESKGQNDCDYDYVEVRDYRNDEQLSQRHLCLHVSSITSEGNRLVLRFVSDSTTHALGFRAEYKRLGCGEHLYDNYGSLESPEAPYSIDVDCEWYIEAPFGKQIRLEITDLHIETDQRDCKKDVFLVAEEKNSSSTALLKSCQVFDTTQILTSPGNHLYVLFRSSDTRLRKFFKSNYAFVDGKCGGSYKSPNGVITSPNYYAGNYAENIECNWDIEVPDSNGINLHFETFNLTEKENCQGTFFEIKKLADQNEVFLEKACSSEFPLISQVHGNHMSIKFNVANGGWGRFKLHYERQCGGVLYVPEGFIKSRLDEECVWILNGPKETKISVFILNLECPCTTNKNCSNELKIYDDTSSVLLYNACAQHQSNIIASTNIIRVVATNINFQARYTTIQNSCGGNITSLRGSLVSPNYPNSYPANIECEWTLKLLPGNALELSFETLNIAKSPNCNEDFLELRLGSEQGELLSLYCGDEKPIKPLFVQLSVWIKFRSIPGSSSDGFKLNWNYVHENELNGTRGIIQPPPIIVARFEEVPYRWRIFVKRGQLIDLDVKEYNGGLLLYDGFDESAISVNLKNSPWRFSSSSNVLLIKSQNSELDEFKIEWSSVSSKSITPNTTISDCGGVIVLPYNARWRITSPGYPKGYANNLNCEWIFKVEDPTQHAIVDLFEVKLEKQSGCWSDSLRISSSSNLRNWHEELKICDSRDASAMPFQTIQGTPYLKMNFNSDMSINGTGFKVLARTACGSNMTGSVGTILDNHIARARSVNTSCLWHVEVRPGRQIEIQIEYEEEPLKKHEDCPHYGLIYEGLDDQGSLLQPGKFCNQIGFRAKTFRSKSNHIFIKYVVPTYFGNPHQNLWNLTYREFSECDGELRLTKYATSVNITSPGYPYIPHPHTECGWTVIAPPGETITATFVDRFDMNARYCDKEFVELYDGSTTLARRLLRTCQKPSLTRSTGNILFVRYLTDLVEPRSGFKLNLSISSCGGVYMSSEGIISSEHYPAIGAYPAPAICEYTIKLPQTTRIRINFTDLHLPYNKSESNNDRIELLSLDTLSPLIVFFGNETNVPSVFEVDNNKLLIRFVSVGLSKDHRGFRLEYQRIYGICYREVTGTSGQLTITPRERILMFTICRWRINVPKGQRVNFKFLDLEQPPVTNNNTERFLRIVHPGWQQTIRNPTSSFYNDEQAVSQIAEFELSNYNDSVSIQSTDNFMLVKISFGQHSNTMTTIRAQYNAIEDSPCPENIDESERGLVDVSALQHLKTFYCTVRFNVQRMETITFNIAEYAVWRSYSTGAIKFTDEELHIPIMFLNQNISNGVVSFSPTRAKLELWQNKNTKLIHFQSSYRRHKCGGSLKMEEGLTLTEPTIMEPNYGVLECVWTLKSTYDDLGYTFLGNISLSDSCEREYFLFYTGIRAFAPEPTRFCGNMQELNRIQLDKIYATVVYHSESFYPGRSRFKLTLTKDFGGNTINVDTIPSKPISIDSKHYKNNMELTWEFSTIEGMYLSLIFKSRFFLEDSPNCVNDSLEIQHYHNDIWYSDVRFCGRVVPPTFNITSNRMRVIFRTNEAVTGDGFSFVVASTCDIRTNVTADLQTLSGPKIGDLRTNTCSYLFETDTDSLIILRVKYKERFLPSPNSLHCDMSNFKAYKKDIYGEEEFVDKYCTDFEISGSHKLRLNYNSFLDRGFEIQYQLNTCGGNFSAPFELRPQQGIEPNKYAANMNCVWHVNAPADHAIVLHFKSFNMEDHDCRYDHLDIYKGTVPDKDQRVANLCGDRSNKPPLIVIDSNHAVIVAISDATREQTGFLANVRFSPNCNERIALSEGNAKVTLQRHVNLTQSEDMLCYYRITSPPGHRVSAEIKDLHLNPIENNCTSGGVLDCNSCNYLEVFDSLNSDGQSLGKYCASGKTDGLVISSFEDLLLKITGNIPGKFSLELSLQMEHSSCGDTEYTLRSNESINILMPLNNETSYAPNTHCTWRIQATGDLEIDFKHVQLPTASQITGKCMDYVHLKSAYNGKYFCGNFNKTQMYQVYVENVLEVTFHSDNTLEQDGGFELSISYGPSICNTNLTELSKFISVSSFPTANKCSFEIRLPDEYTLSMSILTMTLGGSSVGDSYIRVIDLKTNETLKNYNESFYITKNLHTKTQDVRIETLNLSSLRMFYMSTNKSLPSGCGGNIFAMEGEFSNPSYVGHNYSECIWDVTVPSGNQISVYFSSFNMGSETNCNLDNIKIYEVQLDGSQMLKHFLCGDKNVVSYKLSSNRMIVVAKKSPNFDGDGFSLVFNTLETYDLWTKYRSHHEFV